MGEDKKHYKAKYGDWAGNPNGHAPDFSRCCEEVHSHDGWRYHQCGRKRGHGPDGAYCKQHDPVAVAARKEKSEAKHRAAYRSDMQRAYGPTFLAALREIAEGHNDPRGLAQEIVSDFDAKYPLTRRQSSEEGR